MAASPAFRFQQQRKVAGLAFHQQAVGGMKEKPKKNPNKTKTGLGASRSGSNRAREELVVAPLLRVQLRPMEPAGGGGGGSKSG